MVSGALQAQYVWSGALRVVAELDGSGAVKSRFLYGNKVNVPDLVVQPDPSGDRVYRVITDHLGSPLFVVNVADPSDVMLEARYDEWGNVLSYASSTGSWPVPFGFAGGLYDEETKLVRFGVRDYDPVVGRWTSKDPIRWEGGQANLYVYSASDGINLIDYTGRSPTLITAAIGAGLGAIGGAIGGYLTGGTRGILAGAVGGAVTGGLAGLTGGLSLAGSAIGGAGAGFAGLAAGTGVNLLTDGPPPGPGDVVAAGLGGAASPFNPLRSLAAPGLLTEAGEATLASELVSGVGTAVCSGAVGAAVSNSGNDD